MRQYKTIRGFVNLLNDIEGHGIMHLKGYEKLSDEQKELLGVVTAEISNCLSDFNETVEFDVIKKKYLGEKDET